MVAPSRTPDLDRLARDAGSYVKANYGLLGTWAVGLLMMVCALAGHLAFFGPRLRDIQWLDRLSDVTFESAWHVVLHEEVGKDEPSPFVGCELDDGSYIGGTLWSFSSDIDETADREISLAPPIFYRATEADSDLELANVGTATVSSRRIKFPAVTYFKQRGRRRLRLVTFSLCSGLGRERLVGRDKSAWRHELSYGSRMI